MGRSRFQNAYVVEIYDSTYKSWRIAGHLSKDLQVTGLGMLIGMGMGMTLPMVFCDSSFYCLTVFNGALGVLGWAFWVSVSEMELTILYLCQRWLMKRTQGLTSLLAGRGFLLQLALSKKGVTFCRRSLYGSWSRGFPPLCHLLLHHRGRKLLECHHPSAVVLT